MKNVEKFLDELCELQSKDGIAVVNGKPVPCGARTCKHCYLQGLSASSYDCYDNLLDWLFSEYKEKPTLTKRQYHFLKSLPSGSAISIAPQPGGKYSLTIQTLNSDMRWIEGSLFGDVFPPLPIKNDNLWHDVNEMLTWNVKEEV